MFKHTHITSSILIIAGIFIASNLYTMLPIQVVLTKSFHISLEQAALSSFCFIISYAFGLLCFGMLSDRFGERPILLYGMFSLSILTFSISFISVYPLFLLARGVQGFLAASFAPAAFSYIFRHFQGKTQTITIALINTGFLFAGIFGQILSAYLVYSYSLSSLFYAFTGLYFICFVLLFISLNKTPLINQNTYKQTTSIVTLIRHSPLRKLYTTAFFLLLTVMLFYGGFELYLLKDTLDFPMSLQSFRILGLIGIMPAFFASQLVSRYGSKSILVVALLLMAIGFSFSIVYITELTLTISSILMVASTSLTIPMVIMLIGQIASSAIRGRALSVYSFTLLTGASLGSLLAAIIPFHLILIGVCLSFLCLARMIHQTKLKTT